MKFALIMLGVLPVVLAMTIPTMQGEQDPHQEAIQRIRMLSVGKPDKAVGESSKNSIFQKHYINAYFS
jgi:hypothetical protein